MNTEELNVWIAEKLGWKLQPDEWVFENPEAKVYERNGEFKTDSGFRYTSDLNACHEMEKALNEDQRLEYVDELYGTMTSDLTEWFLLHATAHQRCLAFFRTMGGKDE